MSPRPIVLDPDLRRLQDLQLEIEVRNGHLLVHSVPYLDSQRQVRHGILVTNLNGNPGSLGRPTDHQVWFVGDFPHKHDGRPLEVLRHSENCPLWEGFVANYRFSNKPEEYMNSGFPDYSSKMLHYITVIWNQSRAIDNQATPFTGKVVVPVEEHSIFHYWDFASSRAGILAVSSKLSMERVAIVGLGGTGAYVLDQVAKTPVREIHLFDGDTFDQHNAFRAPGAATLEELATRPLKVDYFAAMYGAMHKGIVSHPCRVTEENLSDLAGFNFVFLCIDNAAARKEISDYLIAAGIPFVDTGMDLHHLPDLSTLLGTCRATLCTPEKSDHFASRAPLQVDGDNDLYRSNIQVADMNAFNALFAVLKWKQFCGFYQDVRNAHHLTFSINDQALTRDEMVPASWTTA